MSLYIVILMTCFNMVMNILYIDIPRNLGSFLSCFDRKNQKCLINRRKSSIFTPQNVGNPEKYKMQFKQKRKSVFLEGGIADAVLRDSSYVLSVTQLIFLSVYIRMKSPPN